MLLRSQFPDQGLNPGNGTESTDLTGLIPGTLQHLKLNQQRNSQPRRAEKEPSMRQYKGGELRKKKFSEVASGSLCQMLLRDQVG